MNRKKVGEHLTVSKIIIEQSMELLPTVQDVVTFDSGPSKTEIKRNLIMVRKQLLYAIKSLDE